MTAFAKPSVALGFGAFFLCAVTCTHFDELLATPLLLVSDFAAGLVLIAGGVLSGRDWLGGRQYQIVGWSFMASLMLHASLGNLVDMISPAGAAGSREGSTGLVALSPGAYTLIVAVLFIVSVCGLWMTLATPPERPLAEERATRS